MTFRPVTAVRCCTVQWKCTEGESKGAFTPTKSPRYQTFRDRPKAGYEKDRCTVCVIGYRSVFASRCQVSDHPKRSDQPPPPTEPNESRRCWSERKLPAFVSVRVERAGTFRTGFSFRKTCRTGTDIRRCAVSPNGPAREIRGLERDSDELRPVHHQVEGGSRNTSPERDV
jgi:hypothetical protein